MSAPANPFAFPSPDDGRPSDGYGMELRDWLAAHSPVTEAMALNFFECDDGVDLTSDSTRAAFFAVYALMRYEFADAMLLHRVNGHPLTGLEVEQAAPGTGEKLLKIAREFIDTHRVSCAEATINDGVYEEAPLLVEKLAEVAGYYNDPEDN